MTADAAKGQDAKRVVLDFFDLAFVNREPEQARDRFLGATYAQHDPTAPDGAGIFPTLIGGLVARRRKRPSTSNERSRRTTSSSSTTTS